MTAVAPRWRSARCRPRASPPPAAAGRAGRGPRPGSARAPRRDRAARTHTPRRRGRSARRSPPTRRSCRPRPPGARLPAAVRSGRSRRRTRRACGRKRGGPWRASRGTPDAYRVPVLCRFGRQHAAKPRRRPEQEVAGAGEGVPQGRVDEVVARHPEVHPPSGGRRECPRRRRRERKGSRGRASARAPLPERPTAPGPDGCRPARCREPGRAAPAPATPGPLPWPRWHSGPDQTRAPPSRAANNGISQPSSLRRGNCQSQDTNWRGVMYSGHWLRGGDFFVRALVRQPILRS